MFVYRRETSTSLSKIVSSTNPSWSMVDAPVSGGPTGANGGMLTSMGGSFSPQLFEEALPTLRMMGKAESIYNCGGPGAGLATKQLSNYLAYVGYLGLCEVMNTGLLYVIDTKTLSEVINSSNGINPQASSANDFKGGFTTELAGGVIDDAVALMQEMGTATSLADATKEAFVRARQDNRCKGQEARSIWRLFHNENDASVSQNRDWFRKALVYKESF